MLFLFFNTSYASFGLQLHFFTKKLALDEHLLYNPFNGNVLPAIKVIDYCIRPSISHLHIFTFVLATI